MGHSGQTALCSGLLGWNSAAVLLRADDWLFGATLSGPLCTAEDGPRRQKRAVALARTIRSRSCAAHTCLRTPQPQHPHAQESIVLRMEASERPEAAGAQGLSVSEQGQGRASEGDRPSMVIPLGLMLLVLMLLSVVLKKCKQSNIIAVSESSKVYKNVERFWPALFSRSIRLSAGSVAATVCI